MELKLEWPILMKGHHCLIHGGPMPGIPADQHNEGVRSDSVAGTAACSIDWNGLSCSTWNSCPYRKLLYQYEH